MRKSKHIKASQTILFFFNDFVLSETDGECKAERLAPETKAEKNTCKKNGFEFIIIHSKNMCLKIDRAHYYSLCVLFFSYVVAESGQRSSGLKYLKCPHQREN